MDSRQVQNESGPSGHVWTDYKFDMVDSSSFDGQPMSFPSTAMESKATPWPVDLVPSAETLPRYPQVSIPSVRLAAGLKRKHLSSGIRKNNYPIGQYTPTKATAHYTISQDCTAGSEVRKMQLFADFGKKCQGGKNHFGHLGNMRLGADTTYRQTNATERKVSQFADPDVARSNVWRGVDDRTIMQQLRRKQAYQPRPLESMVYVPNIWGEADSLSSRKARLRCKPCRLCGYKPQCDIGRFEAYMTKHMRSLHPETQQDLPCPYPGCSSQFSRLDNLRRHKRAMHNDVEDENLGMQKRQRIS
ncbi:hypothetical protein DER45DRAFT_307457 [Fusarium avenaceum]|nr:hypothetical protein DER45DRAFT_307457 [Fusarium avenaceum]